MFTSRPHHLHDSRSAMIERILNHLVEIEKKHKPEFERDIENNYQIFSKCPESYPNLQMITGKLKSTGIGKNVRYFSLPLFYPPETDLIRGLSTRKGDASFKESIRDLIRQGAGACDLSEGDANVNGCTWKKIGHAFSTHQKDVFFSQQEGSTYFSAESDGTVNNSAIILIPSEFYHKEYIRGQARIELEGSYNNVFYQGIPKRWIKALYIPQNYKLDIDLVHSPLPIAEVMQKLSTDLFSDCAHKEMKTFRRYLQSKDLIQGKEVSLFQRIHSFGSYNAQESENKFKKMVLDLLMRLRWKKKASNGLLLVK